MSAHIVEANTCLHENDKNSSSSLELSTKPQLHTAVFTTELQSVTQGGNKEAGGAPVLSRHYPPPLSRGDEELHLDNITSPLSNPPSGARFNANPAMERRGTDDHSEYPTTIASHRRDNPYVVVANNECFSRGPNRCNNPLQFSTTTNSTNPLEISLETCQSRYHDVVTPVGDVVLPLNTDLTSLPSASSTSMRLMLTCDGYSEGEGPQLEDSVVLDPFAVPLGRSALSTSVKRLLTEMTGGLNVDFLVDMFYCSDDTLTEEACEQFSWASSKTLVCMVLLLNHLTRSYPEWYAESDAFLADLAAHPELKMAITKSNIYAVFAILLHLVSTVVHQEAWLTVPLICESMNNFRASYKKYQKRCVAEDPNGTVISLPKLAEEHFNKAEIQLLEYLHYNTELNATEFDRCICSLRGDDVESCSSRLLQTVFEP